MAASIKLISPAGGSVTLSVPSTTDNLLYDIGNGVSATTMNVSNNLVVGGSANIAGNANIVGTLQVTGFSNLTTANIATASISTANITTANITTLNVTSLAVNGTTVSGGASFKAQVITSNTSWTVPAGVTVAKVSIAGGGGGGGSGGAAGNLSGKAGGNGGFAYALVTGMIPGSTVTVTVGSAGTGSTYGGTSYASTAQQNGTGGTSSSFGSYITCTGGAAGGYNTSGGTNGTATLANGNITLLSTYTATGNLLGSKGTTQTAGAGTAGTAATGYGYGGGGGDWNSAYNIGQAAGGNGSAGLVFLEWIG